MVASSHERTWPPSRSRGHPSLRFRTNSFILPSLAILISGSLSSSSAHPEPGAKVRIFCSSAAKIPPAQVRKNKYSLVLDHHYLRHMITSDMQASMLTPTASHPTSGLPTENKSHHRPPISSYSSVSSIGSNSSLLGCAMQTSNLKPGAFSISIREAGHPRHRNIATGPEISSTLPNLKYKTPAFRQALLQVLQAIRVPTWTSSTLDPSLVKIAKVSGALTNAVFFVSYVGTAPASHSSTPHLTPHSSSSSLQLIAPRTVLLRIYGPSSSILISRADELHTLHLLSSNYRIGPRVYGTFQNGRVEEWFDSNTLKKEDMRDVTQSRWIAMRMRELHSVDVLGIVGISWNGQESLYKNIVSWQGAAQETLVMLEAKEGKGEIPPGHVWHGRREELNLGKFMRAWEAYWSWLQKWESEFGRSEMVFAHNDAQYGNLLYANKLAPGKPEHHRVSLQLPKSEWTADYHSDTPHVLTASRYPTREERRNFYFGYLGSPVLGGTISASPVPSRSSSFHGSGSSSSINSLGVPSHHSSSGSLFPIDLSTTRGQAELEEAISILDGQVYAWSPASHAHWIIWGIIQASDDITNGAISDFDYLAYAADRIGKFYNDLSQRGIKW
ncbi:choline kinase, cytoplasm [Rhizoctonia solani AG-1 IA]|uniref:Choline kinase, cytoplasm n=1 Tax=Thanatephorus cucumeris (strain AG1-IA) TaxID=983506 RepID=L8X2Q7_THACA|nr:choline kinase, cytoplasm [Rhizoctonia solani AG-1 IA]